MDKATLICAGVLAASLPAGDFSPGSAGAALTLARPLVAHLVGVTLIVLALARLPCALHQPACCALTTVVTLLAPGVANLMCVPLLVLAFLGAHLPAAIHHPSTQAAAAVALVLPPVPDLVGVSVLVPARLVAHLAFAHHLAPVLALALVALNFPPVTRLMLETLLIFAGFSAVLGKALHLASRLTQARVTIPPPLITYFVGKSPVVLALNLVALVGGADNSSSLLTAASIAIFEPLVSNLVRIPSMVPAYSLTLCLAVWLAVLIDPFSGFTPGSSIGRPVLGALVEGLTLVPEWKLASVPLDRLARVGCRCPDNLVQISA